ncbi:hypothetical protein C8R43DRAFT_906657 [Mycena crocata]|nr:hypothetical protein C8R43DRAFT_906657 [Mycena crocata]
MNWITRRAASERPEKVEACGDFTTVQGVQHIKWDGRYILSNRNWCFVLKVVSLSSSPKLILDLHGRIIAILLGRPEDPDWDDVVRKAGQAMDRARRVGKTSGAFSSAKDSSHRRGKYAQLTTGVSFGGGQQVASPGNLVNAPERLKLINYLLRNKNIRRLAGFQSSGLARYAPKLWRFMVDNLQLLFDRHPGLEHNFSNSIFPAATFNLGPTVVTAEHEDLNNVVHGLCGITNGGDFDHIKGGQIYLKQLKLVIDFPSGASMLIPSVFITHGNTPIQPHETRFSFTQYAAGGLMRWVKYGFRSSKSVLATLGGSELLASFDGVPGSRWQWVMGLFSKPAELEADRLAAFGSSYI